MNGGVVVVAAVQNDEDNDDDVVVRPVPLRLLLLKVEDHLSTVVCLSCVVVEP